jgi:hypothetical protein
MYLGRTESEKLPKLKKCVENWHEYFKFNNQRWWNYSKFVYANNISSTERAALKALGKPEVQFNILESQVNRLCGEFAKHMPSFDVKAIDGLPLSVLTPDFLESLKVLEGFLLGMFADNNSDSLKYRFYRDLLIGGFTVGEVITRYVTPKSFEQVIECQRVFDPTLTFFDPMARLSHKGDGEFCGKLIPMTIDDLKREFGTKAADQIKAEQNPNFGGFNWSYRNQQQLDIVLVASMFVKRRVKDKIVKLTNGHVVPLSHYEMLLQAWDEEALLMVPPKILEERETEYEYLDRYKLAGHKILDKVETNFTKFPLVFIDGNSVLIKGQDISAGIDLGTDNASDSDEGQTAQFCKPYIMHAHDMQMLMNFAGQSLAAEMENIVQHQYIVPVEAVPEDQQEAYTNPQIASCLQYNQIYDKDANIQLNAPQVLERRQIPPQLESVFTKAPSMVQMILGNYDAILGVNDKQISGVAIQQGAMQSNATALPYLVGFNNGLNRMAEIIVDLVPKYYNTPRTIPVINPDGKRAYQLINKNGAEDSMMLKYDPNNLQINVEMGVSASVQKQVAIDQIIKLTASSQDVAQFFNEHGLEIIIDNIDIRGVEHLKTLAAQYMQQKQQAKLQGPPPTDAQILAEAEKEITVMQLQVKEQGQQLEAANKAAQIAIEQREADRKFLELMAKIEADNQKAMIERERADAENAKSAVELAVSMISNLGVS